MTNDATGAPVDGWTLFESEKWADAEAAFRATLAMNANDPSALSGLGHTLVQRAFASTSVPHGLWGEAAAFLAKAAPLYDEGSQLRCSILYNWAFALRKEGDLGQALERAEELVKLFPSFVDGWRTLGDVRRDIGADLLRRKDREGSKRAAAKAAEAFDAVLKLDPGNVAAADQLVDVLVEAENFVDVFPAMERLDKLQKAANLDGRKRSLRNWAILLRDRGDLDQAAAKADELVTNFPEFGPGWNTRALIHQGKGDLDGAIRDLRRALKVGRSADPKERANWLHNLGDALRGKGGKESYEEAVRAYREVDRLSPDDPATKNKLGLALAGLKRYPEAIKCYEQAISLWERTGSADGKYPLRNWADVLTDQGELEEAAAKLGRAVEADPKDPESYNRHGWALARIDRHREAIKQFEEAARLWDKSDNRNYALGNCAESLNATYEYKRAEAKCREALRNDRVNAAALYAALGYALSSQGRYDETIEELKEAANSAQSSDPDVRLVLWQLGAAYQELERIRESLKAYERAAPHSPPGEADGPLWYGGALWSAGETDEALAQYDKAIAADPSHPYAYHNKGALLFRLGRYPEGWKAWNEARNRYEAIKSQLIGYSADRSNAGAPGAGLTATPAPPPASLQRISKEVCIERACYFADVLRDIFREYENSNAWYELALKAKPTSAPALCGRAILLRRWSQMPRSRVEVSIRSGEAMRRACEALNEQSDQPGPFSSRLALADLYIEDRDWQRLREELDLREHDCGEMRLRRAQIAVLRGILSLGEEKPEEAERHFNRALEVKKDDLGLLAYRARALLGAKRYEMAVREFERLLYKAPGHVDALLGKARACIELGDAGDPEQYETAEKSLTEALRYGRDGGSLVLRDAEKSNIYYTRGYSKTKRYDANIAVSRSVLIVSALDDFRRAKKIDPLNFEARSALSKLARRVAGGAGGSLARAFGTIFISALAFLVFAFAQIDFFLRGSRMHDALHMPDKSLLDPSWYATITFLSLAMLIAGLSLRDLLKLKVPGIELEKTSTERGAQALPLGLGHLGQFDNNLRGEGSRPRDWGAGRSEGAATTEQGSPESFRPQKGKEGQTEQQANLQPPAQQGSA